MRPNMKGGKDARNESANVSACKVKTKPMHPFESKFETLKSLGKLALYGLALGALAGIIALFQAPEMMVAFFGSFAAILIAPAGIFFCIMPIFHWKARYRGEHSDWWGVLLLLQLSGWPAIIYFFRHVLPDMRRSGRYRLEPDTA